MDAKAKARRLALIKSTVEKIDLGLEDSFVDYGTDRYRDDEVTVGSVARLKEALTEQGVI